MRGTFSRCMMGGIGVLACSCMELLASCITLSSDGKTAYRIVVASEPIPAEVTAAKELVQYLKAVSGADFKTAREDEIAAGSKAVYVGQTNYAATHGIDFNKLGQEEWVIRTTTDGSLILSGGRPRGTLYAVYEFLENNIGCHWLDENNEVIPTVSRLTIPALNIQNHPYFRNRQIFDLLDWYPRSCVFKARNKGTTYVQADYGWSFKIGRPRQHHTFCSYSESWPKTSSELHSLNFEGKRLIATSGEGPGQICMTHPEARRRILSALKEFIAQDRREAAAAGYPAPTVYDLSHNDNNDYCVCDKCKRLAEREGSPSGPLLDFINDIAVNIKKEYPDICIRTFAYGYSIKPPKHITPADNVIIHIGLGGYGYNGGVRDDMRELTNPDNKWCRDLIESWGVKAANVAIWDYWIMYPPDSEPYVNISRLQPDMAFYKARNVKDYFAECENSNYISFFGLKRYLGYKLLQNPDRPAQPVIDDFMNGFYGKAAPTMKELLAYMEKRQNENKEPIGKVDVSIRPYLDLNYFKATLGLLDHAETLVDGDHKRIANIRRERIPILAGMFMRWRNLDGVGKQFDASKLIQQFSEDSLAAINYYFPDPDTQTFRKESLSNREKSIRRFENNIIAIAPPSEFKNRQIVDLPWASFRLDNNRTKIVEDREAIGGKTIALGKDAPDKTKDGFTHFEIYDWKEKKVLCDREVRTIDIAKDEKYHLLKIGRVNFDLKSRHYSSAYFYGANTREINCDLTRLFPPGSSYDAYMSVKFQGPDYVPGSAKENSIMVERIVFVEPR